MPKYKIMIILGNITSTSKKHNNARGNKCLTCFIIHSVTIRTKLKIIHLLINLLKHSINNTYYWGWKV